MLTLLKNICFKPRQTIKNKMNGEHSVLFLFFLSFIYASVEIISQASAKGLGEFYSLSTVVYVSVSYALFLGPMGFIVWTFFLKMTGRWLGGNASFANVRLGVGFSYAPYVFAFIITILEIIIFRDQLFKSYIPFEDSFVLMTFFFLFILLHLVFYIWSFIIQLIMLSEVQNFTKLKAFLNILISFLTFIGFIIIVSIPFILMTI